MTVSLEREYEHVRIVLIDIADNNAHRQRLLGRRDVMTLHRPGDVPLLRLTTRDAGPASKRTLLLPAKCRVDQYIKRLIQANSDIFRPPRHPSDRSYMIVLPYHRSLSWTYSANGLHDAIGQQHTRRFESHGRCVQMSMNEQTHDVNMDEVQPYNSIVLERYDVKPTKPAVVCCESTSWDDRAIVLSCHGEELLLDLLQAPACVTTYPDASDSEKDILDYASLCQTSPTTSIETQCTSEPEAAGWPLPIRKELTPRCESIEARTLLASHDLNVQTINIGTHC